MKRSKEAPANSLHAMTILVFTCISVIAFGIHQEQILAYVGDGNPPGVATVFALTVAIPTTGLLITTLFGAIFGAQGWIKWLAFIVFTGLSGAYFVRPHMLPPPGISLGYLFSAVLLLVTMGFGISHTRIIRNSRSQSDTNS